MGKFFLNIPRIKKYDSIKTVSWINWTQDRSTLQFGHVSNRTDQLNELWQEHRPVQKLRDVR
jgi:hypothetical protein